jgi:hypothetical protein
MPHSMSMGDGMIVIKWRSSREVPVDSQDLASITANLLRSKV